MSKNAVSHAPELQVAKDLQLPLRAVTEKLAWLGRTGSGKTYGASKLAEQMLDAGAQIVTIDPVGVWYGLRLSADGKSPGIAIPVFGGLHGDVPLESTSGAMVADLVVDRGISIICDVSQFELDTEKTRFARDFATRFFYRKKAAPSAVHVFLEECQEFVPERPQKGEEHMLHAFQRMWKLGRNFGIGGSLISQRPQDVNKKALNLTELIFAFQLTGPHERKALEGWISEKGIDEDIGALLPKLSVGEARAWSPSWLRISETIKILPKRTFNASSTPEVGKRLEVRDLAPIDLERIRKDMAETIERAKTDDPKELRKRIAELEKAAKVPVAMAKPSSEAITAAHVQGLEEGRRESDERLRQILTGYEHWTNSVKLTATDIQRRLNDLHQPAAFQIDETRKHLSVPSPVLRNGKPGGVITRPAANTQRKQPTDPAGSQASNPRAAVPSSLPRPQKAILDGLAWLEAIGLTRATRNITGCLAGASPRSSAFVNNLGSLRTAGFIDYPGRGDVSLTDTGRDVADRPKAPPNSEQLHQMIYAKLPRPQSAILQTLIGAYPGSLSREGTAEGAGASPTSSAFVNNLGALRSLGLIDYPGKGEVVALPLLFL